MTAAICKRLLINFLDDTENERKISLLGTTKWLEQSQARERERVGRRKSVTTITVLQWTESYQLHWLRLSAWLSVFAKAKQHLHRKHKQISSISFLLPPSVCLSFFLLSIDRATLRRCDFAHEREKHRREPNRCVVFVKVARTRINAQQSAILIVVYATFTQNVADL